MSRSPNLHMLLKELLRSFLWTVEEATNSVEGAIETVASGRAYLIVIDDTVEEPAVSVMRRLLTDPITCCTPTLSFLLDHHQGEAHALAKMGPIEIVPKPLTPSKFLPGFRSLIAKWETRPYLALRMGIHQYLRSGSDAGHNTMKKLIGLETIFPLVAQNMSLVYRKRGNLADAEKILLHALKKHPKDLGVMLALGDLYMHCAMPKMALRLFQGARTVYGDTMAVFPDLAQSALLLGHFPEAANFLQTMYRREFRVEETLDYLTRIQFADGRAPEAEKMLANKKGQYRKIVDLWTTASEPLQEAS